MFVDTITHEPLHLGDENWRQYVPRQSLEPH